MCTCMCTYVYIHIYVYSYTIMGAEEGLFGERAIERGKGSRRITGYEY